MFGLSTLRSFDAPYSALESLFYDAVLAPAVSKRDSFHSFENMMAFPESGRVLDVGCGGGQAALDLASRHPELEIVGVDLSKEQVARARKRASESHRRVRFVQGSALDLVFADATFDVVYSVASIKHWPDRRRGLEECVRVLRPGGQLLVIEADRGCRQHDAEEFVRGFRLPQSMWPLSLAFFRVIVAGRSIDLDDARELLATLPLEDKSVSRVEGAPALMMRGRRLETSS